MQVVKNVNIFDGVNDTLIRNAALVLQDGKIKEILPECDLPFENIDCLDAKGGYLSPGFIDCHLHMTLDEVPDKERLLNYQSAGGVLYENVNSYIALRAAEFARIDLESGFTTVVDGGGVDYVDVALRDAIKLNYITGPDLYICGKQIIAWPSSHFRGLGVQAAGPGEMRKAVRDQIYFGVDQIKIENSAPLRSVGRSLEKSSFTVEEIQAATDEAHSMGLPVQVHARGANPVKVALKGGVDLICHGTGIDDEGINMMLKNDVYLLPTLASPNPEPAEHILAAKSSRVIDILKQTGEIQWESVRKAYKAGVKIALSTDAGGVGIKHGESAKEFLRMREIGMSNLECLRAGTSEAAKAMCIDDKVGVVAQGKKADLVIMKDNPLDNLEATCSVSVVILAGKIIKNTL